MNQRGDCFGNQEAARVGHHMAMPRIDLSNIHGYINARNSSS
jgi:hypothetical protein